jgi:hypothetical protein
MSIQAVAWALEQTIPALGPKLVLVVLANHADHSSGLCWPSIKLIAHEASCSPRAVYRYVADLTRNGYVSVEKKRGKDGKRRSNNYWLIFDRLPIEWIAIPQSHAQDAEVKEAEDQEIVEDETDDDEPRAIQSPSEVSLPEVPTESMTPGVNDKQHAIQSPGPCATAGTHKKNLSEPSCLEPSRSKPLRAPTVPARYDGNARPTAQASAAAEEARQKNVQVFVIEHTPAMDAWEKRRGRAAPRTSHPVDGKLRRGWWFPSLFPPPIPESPSLSPEDSDAFLGSTLK